MPPVLAGRLGYLLARVGGRVVRDLNKTLASFGLRSRHYTALLLAADGAGLAQRDLAGVLGLDPSAVVAIVDDLVRDGLVRREPHPGDRRTRLVAATDAGRARLAEVQESVNAIDEALVADLNAAELEIVCAFLERNAVD
ncbi:MarR family winged helix-turn-helix transcriptional regulator [Amycolatopsis benzoatilytica]|uniref:MarR family winged helix-turn-helix transcriptional regulator n=1 Tax=Amycolatopsis benzoatilytica TaxID=346045 RepID=UPI0003825DA6|nr:MarR family transcriptional regulator [Amycolatopsis benzoatilytica]